jgi:thiol-disulfide isomerase/thioredoxin
MAGGTGGRSAARSPSCRTSGEVARERAGPASVLEARHRLQRECGNRLADQRRGQSSRIGARAQPDQETVLNIYASWCAPCQIEHPMLMRLAQEPGIRLVGIDYKDPGDAGRRWIPARPLVSAPTAANGTPLRSSQRRPASPGSL